MRDTASRFSRRRSLWIAAAAVPTAAALSLSLAAGPATAQSSIGGSSGLSDYLQSDTPPERSPINTEYPEIEGLPAGVSVDRVEWYTNRHLSIFINSAAMPDSPIQVQMLLARDWHSSPERDFPEVWALDGLRARDDESGWTIETNIEQFYADKNVNVIMPVGGESSFYADWQQPDNGKHYKWESFLTRELIPVLENGFRSNGDRAVNGISMGGTAAVNLAERSPQLFDFVGSFSGYLDTTSIGMPQAITAAQQDAGGYNSARMWGQPGSQDWIDHDPKLGVEALRDITVYVSAGNGNDDYGREGSVAKGPANYAGKGLEIISRMSTQTFVNRAESAGVNVISAFRPSGVHSWEYWQYEMTQAWPYMAESLNLSQDDQGADCVAIGAIADATASGVIGSCVNDEYDVAGGEGKAQDFRAGTAYWSPETGAQPLFGRINARYSELGGPSSWLGFPTSGEQSTPDGRGKYVHFENGSIYWTAQTGAYAVPKDIFNHWGTQRYEAGDLRYPVGEAREINGGLIQEFENGYIVRTPEGENYFVRGLIAEKYQELDTVNSTLGYPITDEKVLVRGESAFQEFENGYLYWSASTGAHFIKRGAIFDAWGKKGWERGEFGFPTADQTSIPAGGEIVEFQNGTISQINGRIVEELN
ncbi:Diacylglycerol acyltransferase/mycolyltransferase Ag85C precursor [Corynebacterium occultum]|uniref:Acyl-CoA:diacylglycerol acyltransferase n=1 Tax=Corynebacterium occultum TaxID=2675219 RepID=A0A6B8WB66_9CORY|nr:alpha/beta hydrolase-fold protein [Corynebacterium occultum]QGU08535.1 Diacylglycerol acyltransferase/mycolyltransferase Ag85C precursor [Corynebacterium occultum]